MCAGHLLLSTQHTAQHVNTRKQPKNKIDIDFKKTVHIERKASSKEELTLTNRWKKRVKPGDYRMTNGIWKKYNPPQFHQPENKTIGVELHQNQNKMIWKRMEEPSREALELSTRREKKVYRVVKKIRNKYRKPTREKQNYDNSRDRTTKRRENIDQF